jgi:deoxyribodipyrimidine photo-lyase type I
LDISALNLLPKIPWDAQFKTHWQPGEAGARKRTKVFIKSGIKDYKEGRNFPDKKNVSYLSPHLHWGELSPHQIWHDIQALAAGENEDCFKSELGWREFSHALLYYFRRLHTTTCNLSLMHFHGKKCAITESLAGR